jgi:hypothetical protein
VDTTREADELVRRWQELQAAQVAGDLRALATLRLLAEAQARRPGASGEWELLAREAGRYTSQLGEQVEAQPTAAVGVESAHGGFEPVEQYHLDEVSVPDSAWEPADEEQTPRRGRGLGPIIWLVIVVGYLLLQVIGGLTGGESP